MSVTAPRTAKSIARSAGKDDPRTGGIAVRAEIERAVIDQIAAYAQYMLVPVSRAGGKSVVRADRDIMSDRKRKRAGLAEPKHRRRAAFSRSFFPFRQAARCS